jgi:hypothetical protein
MMQRSIRMNHRTGLKALAYLSLPVLLIMGLDTRDGGIEPKLAQSAEAVVGVPVSPLSVGGVARRTTRRTVAYTSTASASAAASSAAAADAEAAAASAAAQSQPAAAPLPAGSVVTALPSGCSSMTIDGGSYFNCGGTIFKPTFQSNNLVYVAQ